MYGETEVHLLRFIRRGRMLGFSMDHIAALVGLWHDRQRPSAEVKRIALNHIAKLDARIAVLSTVRDTLADLAEACRGDARPDCPILRDLST